MGVCDRDPQKAQQLIRRLSGPVPILTLEQLVHRSDLLIEAASASAAQELLSKAVARRKALMILSSGGLLQHTGLLRRAAARKVPVYLPSGALVGLDGIKAASMGRLKSVTLTTRKPPSSFAGAPGVTRRKVRLSDIRTPRVLFQGSASRAVEDFPQNINVAATLALAGIGAKHTRVRIIADPAVRNNVHEIEAVGSFGRFAAVTENRPSPENPKTSQLAVLSAVATLNQILQPVKAGT